MTGGIFVIWLDPPYYDDPARRAAQIVEAMKSRYDAPEDVIARDVKKALTELQKIGAIDG